MKVKKKDLKSLEWWENYENLEYDNIYIVPTTEKSDGYNLAYYLGRIGDEIKIIQKYDCGNIFVNMQDKKYFILRWDFEDVYGGIKFWTYNNKLKYEHGGKIYYND